MSYARRWALLFLAPLLLLPASALHGQGNLPNPYDAIDGWAKAGRDMGAMSAVFPDGNGNIWVRWIIHDRKRLAPVTLPCKQPISQLIIHLLLATSLLLKPSDAFFLCFFGA